MPDTLIRVYEDPSSVSPCSGCSAHIRWHDTLTNKRMPMDVNAVPVKSEVDDQNGRVIVYFSAADSHWATCPASQRFGRRRT